MLIQRQFNVNDNFTLFVTEKTEESDSMPKFTSPYNVCWMDLKCKSTMIAEFSERFAAFSFLNDLIESDICDICWIADINGFTLEN